MTNLHNKIKNKPYPAYRDSGVEWLGKVPKHWKLKKIKYISNPNPSNIDKKSKEGEKEIFLCNYVDVYKNEYIDDTFHFMKATATTDQISKFILKKGDVIVTKDSEVRNDIAVPALVTRSFDNVVCGYHLTHIKPKKIFGDYLFRCFQSKWLQSYFEISANGITRYGISVDKFNSALILIPTEKEQKIIASFLDKETFLIDALIQKKEQKIKLLKEKRSALITQAVTKGVNPNIKMKDSCIEYLGKIPEYWEIKKLRYVGQCQNGISKKAEYFGTGLPFLGYSEVYNFLSLPFTVDALIESTEQERKHYSVMEGDVFFTRTSETIEDIGFTSTCLKTIENAVFSGFLIRFRPNNKFLYKGFSKYYFRSNLHRRFFVKEMNLVTRASLSQELLKRLPILLPPLQDQKDIANFLDKEISRIDSLSEKIKKSIELLKEYRSALITSVVTGQIDIRKSQTKSISIVQFQRQKKEASPLFKKTVLGAEIVTQLKDNPHFGRTKFMKTLYLCEAHLQIPLKGTYKREAAGPLDNSIYKVEGIMKRNKWFEVVKIGSMYKYKPLKNPNGYKSYFDKYWKDQREELDQLLSLVRKFTTEQSEIVDTIYAVWNDFLLEGKKPSDNEVIYEVRNNWHKSKKRFSDNQLQRAIDWMKKQNLIPKGYGPKTKTKTNRDIR